MAVTEEKIIEVLRDIYDPEIPVNIYDLGLIYEINIKPDGEVHIKMTLTAPNCPVAESLPQEVKQKVSEIEGVKKVEVELVFDPPFSMEMMSEEAKLALGLL
ncbi:MAG: SUF system Fe-S cluster assembly protein [Candidatus Hydrogenedentota bacterium]|nr:MAG: SUF system Fe-S cluster assembly protein [Candidatus Hydrogenedentota bacterium]